MFDSKELIKRTGISRATLNNYIALGLLPRPTVMKAAGEDGHIPRLGYFPDSALDTILKVQKLKQQGLSMAEIATIVNRDRNGAQDAPLLQSLSRPPADTGRTAPQQPGMNATAAVPGGGLRLTLDQVDQPAYLVNSLFEAEWANDIGMTDLLGLAGAWPTDIKERNLFTLLFGNDRIVQADGRDDLLRFHVSIAKHRLSKSALLSMDADLTDEQIGHLANLYDEAEAAHPGKVAHERVNLAPRGAEPEFFDIYASFFREGIFFAYAPASSESETLMQLLARRDIVIRDLLKRRRPYLTPMAVVVADLEDSVKICAELPPEEYFELINDIWGAMEPYLRKYYATHGKHVGDGMVYYFFPQPDCDYVMNAIRCAHEMQSTIAEVSRAWRKRKNWMNDLKLNIGLVEGQEWFGAYQTPTHLEFTVLGDTMNVAGRLSDFARGGSVWVTKAMLGQLAAKMRERVSFGIRRRADDGAEVLVQSTYSRVSNLIDLDNPKNHKFRDIAVLPITEVLDVEVDD